VNYKKLNILIVGILCWNAVGVG